MAQQKCVEKHTEVIKQIPNLKPDSYYVDLVNKQVAKKMVGQSNEIASINSKIASLEKVVSQHTTTLDHDLVNKVAKLETEVAKKMVGQSNNNLVNEIASIKGKVGNLQENKQQIETRIKRVEGLGSDLKHLVEVVEVILKEHPDYWDQTLDTLAQIEQSL